MADTTSFRSSINGFNREDVVTYISGMLEKLSAAEKKSADFDALTQERDALSQELADLKEKYDALEQSYRALEESSEALSVKCASYEKTLKNNESKLGAAMMEAKRFSEMLVKEANDRAGEVYREAYDSVSESAASAKEIDAKMRELSGEFDRTMGELRRSMKKVIGSMRTFTDNAKENGAKFLYQSEFSGEED